MIFRTECGRVPLAVVPDNFCRLTTSDRRIAVKRGKRDMSTTACDSWRQLLPSTNSRQATAVRAAAKRDSTGRRPWLTPFRDCACSAACRGVILGLQTDS